MPKYSLKEDPRPATLWYWRDWRGDLQVQRCSLAAQGLWMNILGIMGESETKGTLVISGEQVTSEELARILGRDQMEIVALLVELEKNHVFSRLEDGTIYNRRMYRQSQISAKRAEAGRLGAEAKHQILAKDSSKTLANVSGKSLSNNDGKTASDNEVIFIGNESGKNLTNVDGKTLAKDIAKGMAKDGMDRSYSSLEEEGVGEETISGFKDNPGDIELTNLLIDLMLENNPESSIIKKMSPKRKETWINECRLLRESDGKKVEEIRKVIMFSQGDPFWKTNILSMAKLREKWDQLWLKVASMPGNDEPKYGEKTIFRAKARGAADKKVMEKYRDQIDKETEARGGYITMELGRRIQQEINDLTKEFIEKGIPNDDGS